MLIIFGPTCFKDVSDDLAFKAEIKRLHILIILLRAEVKNSQVILRTVLPSLTKFLQKSQNISALFQEVAEQSAG